jgi:hypothetical protein
MYQLQMKDVKEKINPVTFNTDKENPGNILRHFLKGIQSMTIQSTYKLFPRLW